MTAWLDWSLRISLHEQFVSSHPPCRMSPTFRACRGCTSYFGLCLHLADYDHFSTTVKQQAELVCQRSTNAYLRYVRQAPPIYGRSCHRVVRLSAFLRSRQSVSLSPFCFCLGLLLGPPVVLPRTRLLISQIACRVPALCHRKIRRR